MTKTVRKPLFHGIDDRDLEDDFKLSLGLGELSLLLMSKTDGFYQMVKSNGSYMLLKSGSNGFNPTALKTGITEETTYLVGREDIAFHSSAILKIKYDFRKVSNLPFENCGKISIKTPKKRYEFALLGTVTPGQVSAFFKGLPFTCRNRENPPHVLSESEKLFFTPLRKVSNLLLAISLIMPIAFLNLPGNFYTYRILSAVCIIIPIIMLWLYIQFGSLLSFEDRTFIGLKGNPVTTNSSMQVIVPLLAPSGGLLFRTLLDFTVTDILPLLIWSGVLFALLLLVFLLLTKEYRHNYGAAVLFVLFAAIYTPSVVVQLNCLYDYHEAIVYESVLLSKDTTGERDWEREYYYTVGLPDNRTMRISITENFYNMKNPGELVYVFDNPGLLGIDYVFIYEGEPEMDNQSG